MSAPNPLIEVDASANEEIGRVEAHVTEGLDHAYIYLRFDGGTGPGRALLLLARTAIEVVVHARKFRRPS